MVQAHTSGAAARSLATSAASSPGAALLIGSLFDLLATLRKNPSDPAATTPILLRLAAGARRSSDLAQELHLDQSTISRHVAALELEGLVRRTPDDADRRAHRLELTPEGEIRARQRVVDRVRLIEAATAGWPEDDVTTLARLLDDFTTGLRAQERTPS